MYQTPVLINIYRNQNRVKNLFGALSQVKPAKLYIFQDGGINDEIISQLDENLDYAKSLITWECDVKTYRLSDDIGPAAAEYHAYKWMFAEEETGIIIEDDLIPNKAFFEFAEAMLAKYRDNEKVSYISGTNPYGVFGSKHDYFFSTRGPLYGWATWKRFIDTLDASYKWLDDPNAEQIMLDKCCDEASYKSIAARAAKLRQTSTPDFEIMVCAATVMNGQYAIVPKYNLVMNCGIDTASVNGAKSMFLMPKRDQKAYYAKTYSDYSFADAPDSICEEPGYRKYYDNSSFKKIYRLSSMAVRRVIYNLFLRNKKSAQ